jgi:hypothetical protein
MWAKPWANRRLSWRRRSSRPSSGVGGMLGWRWWSCVPGHGEARRQLPRTTGRVPRSAGASRGERRSGWCYLGRAMTEVQLEQLVAAVGALPAPERVRVATKVIEGLSADERKLVLQRIAPPADSVESIPSMLGLFADEPELVDEVCRRAYADRATAEPRPIDE